LSKSHNRTASIDPSFGILPSDEEWKTLVVFAGGNEIAGKKLKAKNEWKQPDEWEQLVVKDEYNGIDEFGFSALPGDVCQGILHYLTLSLTGLLYPSFFLS